MDRTIKMVVSLNVVTSAIVDHVVEEVSDASVVIYVKAGYFVVVFTGVKNAKEHGENRTIGI